MTTNIQFQNISKNNSLKNSSAKLFLIDFKAPLKHIKPWKLAAACLAHHK